MPPNSICYLQFLFCLSFPMYPKKTTSIRPIIKILIYSSTWLAPISRIKVNSILSSTILFIITTSIQLLSCLIGYNLKYTKIASFQILIYIVCISVMTWYIIDVYQYQAMWYMWYGFGLTTIALELLILFEEPFKQIVIKVASPAKKAATSKQKAVGKPK